MGSWPEKAHQVLGSTEGFLEGLGDRGRQRDHGGASIPGLSPCTEVAGTGLSEDPGKTECPFAGEVSWDQAQAKHMLERLQYLFTNVSLLTGNSRVGLYARRLKDRWGLSRDLMSLRLKQPLVTGKGTCGAECGTGKAPAQITMALGGGGCLEGTETSKGRGRHCTQRPLT